jgi:hypothetical protein
MAAALVLAGVQVFVDIGTLVVFGCVAVDVAREVRFRRAQAANDLVAVGSLHRVYAVGPVFEHLARAGVPAFPRGFCHRALLSFFGPFVPVDVLVPRAHRGAADALVRRLAIDSGGPPLAIPGEPAAMTLCDLRAADARGSKWVRAWTA